MSFRNNAKFIDFPSIVLIVAAILVPLAVAIAV